MRWVIAFGLPPGSLATAVIERYLGPICVPSGGDCTGTDYKNYVDETPQDILKDLGADASNTSCNLRNVSWVIPDGNWSDHPGEGSVDAGPSWVAAIVNAVGGYDNRGHRLLHQCSYWQNTVVLVTWDDWGGFYDDIAPPYAGYPNGKGRQYVYGFRVPLIVVSAYAKPNYVSGACNGGPCSPASPFIHDFGSILDFVEYAFGSGGSRIGPGFGISGAPQLPYADYFAPDGPYVCAPTTCPYGLSDFFNFSQPPRTFTPIGGAAYQTDCFLNASTCLGFPQDPDNDAVD